MNLLAIGCNYRTAPVALREKIAIGADSQPAILRELASRVSSEAVVLSTCNRVEIYLGRPERSQSNAAAEGVVRLLAEYRGLAKDEIAPHLFVHERGEAIAHLFRVAASLDSLIIGEGQIAGQVKQAYEQADSLGTVGPILHTLFQRALKVAKRARTETNISEGHVSVSSVAVDYVRQVFESFNDKTMLVIGAGKMGELTLRHLKKLAPFRILVANRSADRAKDVAAGCGGNAIAWENLDDALTAADIVLSTTGSPEPIMSLPRWRKIEARREGRSIVILDIAVPRDFDPRIHDGDLTCLFNIDDLQQVREQTLRARQGHIAKVEAIIVEERDRLVHEWAKRENGPTIARLTQNLETKRRVIVQQLFTRLNGKLGDDDRAYIEGAFRLMQNQFLHAPLSALAEEPGETNSHTLLSAMRKLFGLSD